MKFSTLVSRAVEDSFLSLKDLVDKSKATQQYDSDKKISLLKHLVYTQLRMLRINVLGKWCQQVKKIFFLLVGFLC
jgi:mediator of RNA polymerase II transcription subunit 14